jgi:hypothetical protein
MTMERYYSPLESGMCLFINIVTVIFQYCEILSVKSKSLII